MRAPLLAANRSYDATLRGLSGTSGSEQKSAASP